MTVLGCLHPFLEHDATGSETLRDRPRLPDTPRAHSNKGAAEPEASGAAAAGGGYVAMTAIW